MSRPTSTSPWSSASWARCLPRGSPGRSRPMPTGCSRAKAWACVILKRRRDAERDGDRIYAVMQGLGLASDGQEPGPGRAERPRSCPRDPPGLSTVGDRSRHGDARRRAWAGRARRRSGRAASPERRLPAPPYGRRALGAVSSMIGHAMPAAGMAGLDQDGPVGLSPGLAPDLARRETAPAPRSLRRAPSHSTAAPGPGSMPTRRPRGEPASTPSASRGSMPTPCSRSTPPPPTAMIRAPSVAGRPRPSCSRLRTEPA